MKYKGKCVRDRFAPVFVVCSSGLAPILIKSDDELSKCSLKYEPSVFNINTNVTDGITWELLHLIKEISRKQVSDLSLKNRSPEE